MAKKTFAPEIRRDSLGQKIKKSWEKKSHTMKTNRDKIQRRLKNRTREEAKKKYPKNTWVPGGRMGEKYASENDKQQILPNKCN